MHLATWGKLKAEIGKLKWMPAKRENPDWISVFYFLLFTSLQAEPFAFAIERGLVNAENVRGLAEIRHRGEHFADVSSSNLSSDTIAPTWKHPRRVGGHHVIQVHLRGKPCGLIRFSLARITARSTALRISRRFPGQG